MLPPVPIGFVVDKVKNKFTGVTLPNAHSLPSLPSLKLPDSVSMGISEKLENTRAYFDSFPSLLSSSDAGSFNYYLYIFFLFFITVIILIGAGYIAYGLYLGSKFTNNPADIQKIITAQILIVIAAAASLGQVKPIVVAPVTSADVKIEGFDNPPVVPKNTDPTLTNIQPLTVKQSGFLGPILGGVFDEVEGVKNTLKSKVRTFLFQIDNYEGKAKDSKLFPAPGEPCLVYRDDSGNLSSLNSGSILKTAQAIADNAFVTSTEPIIIILHNVKSPNPITDTKNYLGYCSKIAMQLKPLTQYHLGLTPQGDYHRQALDSQIFTAPFTSFNKSVLILSTFDTTAFRNTKQLGIPEYDPYSDLDYWTHAQLYKNNAVPNGATSIGRYIAFNDIATMTTVDQNNWIINNKGLFTLVVPNMTSNPSYANTETMIKKMGVNVLPLDLFSFDVAETKRLLENWNNMSWNTKAAALYKS